MPDVGTDFTEDMASLIWSFTKWFGRRIERIDFSLPSFDRHKHTRKVQERRAEIENEYADDLCDEYLEGEWVEEDFDIYDPENLILEFETVQWDKKAAMLTERLDDYEIPYGIKDMGGGLVGIIFNKANLIPITKLAQGLINSGIHGMSSKRFPNLDSLLEQTDKARVEQPRELDATKSVYAYPHNETELDRVADMLNAKNIAFEVIAAKQFDSLGHYVLAIDSESLSADEEASLSVSELSDRTSITTDMVSTEALDQVLAEGDYNIDAREVSPASPDTFCMEIKAESLETQARLLAERLDKAEIPFYEHTDPDQNKAFFVISNANAPICKDIVDTLDTQNIQSFRRDWVSNYADLSKCAVAQSRAILQEMYAKHTGLIEGSVENLEQAQVLRDALIENRIPFEMNGRDFTIKEVDALRCADKIPQLERYAQDLSKGKMPGRRTPNPHVKTSSLTKDAKALFNNRDNFTRSKDVDLAEKIEHAKQVAREQSKDRGIRVPERQVERS